MSAVSLTAFPSVQMARPFRQPAIAFVQVSADLGGRGQVTWQLGNNNDAPHVHMGDFRTLYHILEDITERLRFIFALGSE